MIVGSAKLAQNGSGSTGAGSDFQEVLRLVSVQRV